MDVYVSLTGGAKKEKKKIFIWTLTSVLPKSEICWFSNFGVSQNNEHGDMVCVTLAVLRQMEALFC